MFLSWMFCCELLQGILLSSGIMMTFVLFVNLYIDNGTDTHTNSRTQRNDRNWIDTGALTYQLPRALGRNTVNSITRSSTEVKEFKNENLETSFLQSKKNFLTQI